MSLDIYLEIEEEVVFTKNITHNLNKMAAACGLYDSMWRPENIYAEKAKDIISFLKSGIANLKLRPEYYKKFNPENGWGNYEQLIETAENYLKACEEYPESKIYVSR